jgi:hypothetical protein
MTKLKIKILALENRLIGAQSDFRPIKAIMRSGTMSKVCFIAQEMTLMQKFI